MKIKCDVCHKTFVLSGEKLDFVQKAIENKMTFIMLECDICKHTFPLNPQVLNSKFEESVFRIRCPVKGCYGWVSEVENFYGCGQCGTIWENIKELLNDINNIISKYPYRRDVYDLTKFIPSKNDRKEPENYEELVRKELFE